MFCISCIFYILVGDGKSFEMLQKGLGNTLKSLWGLLFEVIHVKISQFKLSYSKQSIPVKFNSIEVTVILSKLIGSKLAQSMLNSFPDKIN